jgi:hypothetical protein
MGNPPLRACALLIKVTSSVTNPMRDGRAMRCGLADSGATTTILHTTDHDTENAQTGMDG